MAIISIGEYCSSELEVYSNSLPITATSSYPSAVIRSGVCCEECRTPFIVSDVHEGDTVAHVFLDMADGTTVQESVGLNTATIYNNYAAITLPVLQSGDRFRVSVSSAKCTSKSKWFTVKEAYEDCGYEALIPCDISVKSIKIEGDQVNGYYIEGVDALCSSNVQYRLNGGTWVNSVKNIPTFDGYDGNYLEIRGKGCPRRVVKFYLDSLDTEKLSPLLPSELTPVPPVVSATTTQVSGSELATLSGSCEIGSIKWSNGSTANVINVGAGSYTATCVNVNGESEASPEITVTSSTSVGGQSLIAPVVTTNTTSVFGTDKATISGSCAVGNIVWSTGETTPSINVGVGSYFATCVLESTSSPASSLITISESSTPPATPVPPSISSNVTQVSNGNLAVISGSCPIGNIVWSTGATSNSIMVGAGTYTARCQNSSGLSNESSPVVIETSAGVALFTLQSGQSCGELEFILSYSATPVDVQVRQFGSMNIVYSANGWVTGDSVTLIGLQPAEYVVYYKTAGASSSTYVSSVISTLSC